MRLGNYFLETLLPFLIPGIRCHRTGKGLPSTETWVALTKCKAESY